MLKDPNGMWVIDGNGNLVAQQGDNEFTLQNFIWRVTGSTITVNQARDLMYTMYTGSPISNIAGRRISHRNIKKVAGDHIADMTNPVVLSIHQGQKDFIASEPVQLIINGMLILIPVGRTVQIIKNLEAATIAATNWYVAEWFTMVFPSFLWAVDRTLTGGDNIGYPNLPAELLSDFGYDEAADIVNIGFALYGIGNQMNNGVYDKFSFGQDMNTILNSGEGDSMEEDNNVPMFE